MTDTRSIRGATPAQPRIGTIAMASFMGTSIEFYDFYIYGTAAALVLNGAFFPNLSPLAGQLAAFSTFAVAFIARPVGSLLFGHFGDRVGRKSMLVASLLTMGFATVGIGLLPGYETIGVTAPILLVVLRFVQGIGLGGEWGGAVLLAAENAPDGKRGWYGVFPQFGPGVGYFGAAGSFLLLSATMDEATFTSWGWRVPFLGSAVLVMLGLMVRIRLVETPAFAEVLRKRERSSMPVMDMFTAAPGRLLLGAGTMVISYVLFYLATTFMLSYGTVTMEIPRDTMLTQQIVTIWAMIIGTAISGWASDRYGRRAVLIFGCVFAAAVGLALPLFVATGSPGLMGVALALMLGAMGLCYGPIGSFLPELFEVRYRYTAASFAYTIGGVVGGGFAPLIGTELAASYGIAAVGWYLAAIAVLSAICAIVLPETKNTSLRMVERERD
ncbi:MHS family MFS transporter [Allokutzneria sp. A3M-2-11 16]|uniref:MFS transporter n=1 Tax=Allokutzneria sp. A3M-2-11 16 TaxID=2962043 RepID=UPI0020B65F9A|nr:MFS transporter [Allokutzneria sp. A3M-2-11 16]MCP3799964.1 MHS family MFS transporter [Allokutzneria sp. A3M-2-11 16]